MNPAEIGRKLEAYFRAAIALRGANWEGLPVLPKTAHSPSCRGSYNAFILWIKQLGLRSAECIFDVGANHGDFSRAAAACYPQAQVWLFEPLPTLIPGLQHLATRYPSWNVQPIALGNMTGCLGLQVAEDDCIGSFLGFSEEYQRGNPNAKLTQSIETRVERLDEFCAREKICAIDLLKIDVEGFEFEVLAGGADMLQRTNGLIIEVSLIRQEGGATNALCRMVNLLSEADFQVVDIIPSLFSREEPWRPLEYNLLARRSSRGGSDNRQKSLP